MALAGTLVSKREAEAESKYPRPPSHQPERRPHERCSKPVGDGPQRLEREGGINLPDLKTKRKIEGGSDDALK